jgi:hypothetical protein
VLIALARSLHWYLAIIVNPGAILNGPRAEPVRRATRQSDASPELGVAAASAVPTSVDSLAGTSSRFFAKAEEVPKAMVIDDTEQVDDEEESQLPQAHWDAVARSKAGGEDEDEGEDVRMGDVSDVNAVRGEDVSMGEATDTEPIATPRKPLVPYDDTSNSGDSDQDVKKQLGVPPADKASGHPRRNPVNVVNPSPAPSPRRLQPTLINPSQHPPDWRPPSPPLEPEASTSRRILDDDEAASAPLAAQTVHDEDKCVLAFARRRLRGLTYGRCSSRADATYTRSTRSEALTSQLSGT